MATRDDILTHLQQQATLQASLIDILISQVPGDQVSIQIAHETLGKLDAKLQPLQHNSPSNPPPADGGDGGRIGIGADTPQGLGGNFSPPDIAPYDENVVSQRLLAVADLYYCYQHERLGLFRAVQKLQELFRAGALRLTDGTGALQLYRFDVKSVLRYTREQRMQAYRRVFGYTNAAPPPGARPNVAFHGLLQTFATMLSQLFRDRRIAEVIRGPATTTDATFGSIAATRRAGLDFRANLKQAAYGDANVLTVELLQLLRQSFDILGADDVRQQFGSDNAWDTLEEVQKRYLNEHPVASQRSRMGIAGRQIIRWLAQPFVLVSSRSEFEAHAFTVAESAEEWLTSAESVGLLAGSATPVRANVVPFRKPQEVIRQSALSMR